MGGGGRYRDYRPSWPLANLSRAQSMYSDHSSGLSRYDIKTPQFSRFGHVQPRTSIVSIPKLSWKCWMASCSSGRSAPAQCPKNSNSWWPLLIGNIRVGGRIMAELSLFRVLAFSIDIVTRPVLAYWIFARYANSKTKTRTSDAGYIS